jgi:probable HAF family extracellular repeat protein
MRLKQVLAVLSAALVVSLLAMPTQAQKEDLEKHNPYVQAMPMAHNLEEFLGNSDRPILILLPPEALPTDLGAGGFVAVGSFFSGGGFYWTPLTGVVDIGGRAAVSISEDGRTIVGDALDAKGQKNAAIWLKDKEWRVLGSFSAQAQPCDTLLSSAYDVNDNGRVVVGLGWDGCDGHAFRWQEVTGVVDFGTLVPDRSSRANGVSGDGLVVVGWNEAPTGFRMGAKWVGSIEEILFGPHGVVGEARAANSDGSIIIGQGCNPADTTVSSAWVWKAETGFQCYPVKREQPSGTFYQTLMLALSEDGRVIGGASSFGLDSDAVLWLDGQPHFLKDYLRDNGIDDAFRSWVNTGFITAVSPDGRVIAGYGAGPETFQGYIVTLPPLGPHP